jgi:hypothetical protein
LAANRTWNRTRIRTRVDGHYSDIKYATPKQWCNRGEEVMLCCFFVTILCLPESPTTAQASSCRQCVTNASLVILSSFQLNLSSDALGRFHFLTALLSDQVCSLQDVAQFFEEMREMESSATMEDIVPALSARNQKESVIREEIQFALVK